MSQRRPTSYTFNSKRHDSLKIDVVNQFQRGIRDRTKTDSGNDLIKIKTLESRIGDWNYDERFRRRNLLIFINAMVGLVLALVELEVAWMYSTEELTETGAIRRHLGEPLVSKLMKLTISILTIILMLQIFCLYRLQNQVNREIWGGFYHSWNTKNLLRLFLELLIVSFHPLPIGDGQFLHQSATCLMFLRLYLFTRVFRDCSHVYRSRKDATTVRFHHVICIFS